VNTVDTVTQYLISLLDEVGAEKRPAWQDQALCKETDPEAFFPEKGGSTREAKRICQRCDVRAECLEYALANRERFGIWGGMAERDRRALLSIRGVAA
jgi:WhiB family redox-sensing transcriptional regulator